MKYGEWKTISELEPGSIFETEDGTRAVKSKYYLNDNMIPQCILLQSGEYAHFKSKSETKVRCIYFDNDH